MVEKPDRRGMGPIQLIIDVLGLPQIDDVIPMPGDVLRQVGVPTPGDVARDLSGKIREKIVEARRL